MVAVLLFVGAAISLLTLLREVTSTPLYISDEVEKAMRGTGLEDQAYISDFLTFLMQGTREDEERQRNAYVGLLSITMPIIATAQLIAGTGLWSQRKWAWWLTITIYGLPVLASFLTGQSLGLSITSIVIAGLVIFYLEQPHVRQTFR